MCTETTEENGLTVPQELYDYCTIGEFCSWVYVEKNPTSLTVVSDYIQQPKGRCHLCSLPVDV